jgi:hypothetical protein
MEADVLQQNDAAGVEAVDAAWAGPPTQSSAKATGAPAASPAAGHGLEAHGRYNLALGAVEVGQQDDLGASLAKLVDGRQGDRRRVSSVILPPPSAR